MAHTVEIVLIVVLVIVLGAWYYMAVYKPSCHRGSLVRIEAPALANDEATSKGRVLTAAPQAYVPALNVKPTGPLLNADYQEMQINNVELIDNFKGTSSVGDNSLFSTFADAPKGVSPTMWPTTAEGDAVQNADDQVATVMPGGAQTAQQVKQKYDAASQNQNRVYLAKEGYASMMYGNKRKARFLGEEAGLTPDVFAQYLGVDVQTAKPIINCTKIGAINLPEWHPCWEELNKKISAEDDARRGAVGSSSMSYQTLNMRQ
jgi:hypothetical protein